MAIGSGGPSEVGEFPEKAPSWADGVSLAVVLPSWSVRTRLPH